MLEALHLTRDEEAVYLALLDHSRVSAAELAKHSGIDDSDPAVASLQARGLIAADPDADDQYRVAGPQAMMREALRDAEQSLAAVTASVAALSQRLARGHPAVPSLHEVECVDGRQAPARVRWWRGHARKELRVVDPVGSEDEVVDRKRRPSRFSDGIALRGIYTPAVVDQPEQLEAVKWGLAHGAQARALSSVPVKLTLVDAMVAILPTGSSNRYEDGILVIRQTSLLDALIDYFEVLWSMAMPLDAYRPTPTGGALDTDDRTLLSLLAVGFSDETIGRRLGISGSEAQRRVGRLIEHLGAENRFQAGVQAARRGLF
jgi:hypothetical protein